MKKRINNKMILLLSILLVFIIMGAASAATNDDINTTLSDDSNSEEVVSYLDDTDDLSLLSTDNSENSEMLSDTQADGTFTDFANEIRFYKNGEYQLTRNYTFNKDIDINLMSGIPITESITIDGQGHTFNGNSESRIFAISTDENKTIILKNIIFINGNGRFESTDGVGGALIVGGSGDVTIMNSTFIDNVAYSGGAIHGSGNSNHPLKIFNSIFESNEAYNFGAAFNGNNVLFDNCSFNDNYLKGYGGSTIMGSTNIQILNSNFTNNYVESGRGTVYFYGSNNIISRCFFYNNRGLVLIFIFYYFV